MSTTQAIEAVTLALRSLLQPVAPSVTARALDRARTSVTGRQLNLFLYEVVPNPALRNIEPPAARSSSGLHPPLALDLRYLLTAYGESDDEDTAHRLLAEAMLVLHDAPMLAPSRLEGVLADAGVHLQFERVRLTPVRLPTEEVSKLWTAFQTNFRLSVAYEASVVLIDTQAPGRSALPVLRRGRDAPDAQGHDEGALVGAQAAPQLDRVTVEGWRGSSAFPARTGDRLVIEGRSLGPAEPGGLVEAVFTHPRLDAAHQVSAEVAAESTPERVVVALPPGIPAGFATVALRVDQGANPPVLSNALPLAIATRLGAIAKQAAASGVDVSVACDRVVDNQSAVLLLGDAQVPANLPVTAAGPLVFTVDPVPAAPTDYLVRVRVDGVDSVPLPDPPADPGQPLPTAFDADQQVTLP